MIRNLSAFVLSLMILAGPAMALDGLTAGEEAVVHAVIDGDTVILDRVIAGATQVRLTGIQAPKLPLGRKGFKEWPLAKEAKAALEELVLDKSVRLNYGGARMDRHGRLLAHLTLPGDVWVQGAMLSLGMARVYTFPDNRARATEMYEFEAEARAARRGIWNHHFYAVRNADPRALASDIDTFQIIEGRVTDAADVRGVIYLNFGDNWRDDFTIRIGRKTARLFKAQDLSSKVYKGRKIQVRGWLKSWNGPMIETSHPEQIVILEK